MISENNDSLNKSIASSGSFIEEMRKGIQVKKITEFKPEEKRPVKINKEDKSYLQSALSKAILQRREELTKNDVNESEDEDSDWSN